MIHLNSAIGYFSAMNCVNPQQPRNVKLQRGIGVGTSTRLRMKRRRSARMKSGRSATRYDMLTLSGKK